MQTSCTHLLLGNLILDVPKPHTKMSTEANMPYNALKLGLPNLSKIAIMIAPVLFGQVGIISGSSERLSLLT